MAALNLLAFDTSTEQLSVAVERADGRRFAHEGAGGAQASATLIPVALALLAEAGLGVRELGAIVFGRGPGSFTGLRTACAVAQGLAWGADVPVLPVDTLLAVAEAARARAPGTTRVLALLDARMNEVYAGAYAYDAARAAWRACGAVNVGPVEALAVPADAACGAAGHALSDAALAASPGAWLLAGNAFAAYGPRLPAPLAHWPRLEVLPTAGALLALAPGLIAAGHAVPAAQALPLYIRDKVALTTAERQA